MKLSNEDLRHVVQYIPKDIRKQLRVHAGSLFLGGGFIRSVISGDKISDVDLFGTNKDFLSAVADNIVTGRQGCKKHVSKNAITILTHDRLPIQLITRWVYNEPEELVKDFDFTICQAVVFFNKVTKKWDSVTSERYYYDLAARRLFYTSPQREEEAGGSMLRVIKFVKRGYNIQVDNLASVMSRVLSGVDMAKARNEHQWGEVVSGLLREVDPLIQIDGLELIDDHEDPGEEEGDEGPGESLNREL